MLETPPTDKFDNVPEDLTTTLELPASAQATSRMRSMYRGAMYEVRHPENHKQAVRFLCVGASGYTINLVSFWICFHPLGFVSIAAFITAFLISSTNNFFWNRHWTFAAKEEHPVSQGVRFFAVSLGVFLLSLGIYTLLGHLTGLDKTVCDGMAWALATPISFLAQKLWTFKA
jgi:putative flippase GtrA